MMNNEESIMSAIQNKVKIKHNFNDIVKFM